MCRRNASVIAVACYKRSHRDELFSNVELTGRFGFHIIILTIVIKLSVSPIHPSIVLLLSCPSHKDMPLPSPSIVDRTSTLVACVVQGSAECVMIMPSFRNYMYAIMS